MAKIKLPGYRPPHEVSGRLAGFYRKDLASGPCAFDDKRKCLNHTLTITDDNSWSVSFQVIDGDGIESHFSGLAEAVRFYDGL